MMRILPLALMIALPLATTSAPAPAADADRGPGLPGRPDGAALVYQVRDFDAVSLGGAATVEVRTGPAWSVRAEGPAAALADLRIARDGRSLEIGRRYCGRPASVLERRIVVHVTMPALTALTLGGAGRLIADRAGGTDFTANVGGSGMLRVDRLDARRATLNVGGSGSIAAAGQVDRLEANLGGSGRIVAPGLRANGAAVSAAGSGDVRLIVDGPADVSLAGSAVVDLGPRARCTVSRIGSGRARCGG